MFPSGFSERFPDSEKAVGLVRVTPIAFETDALLYPSEPAEPLTLTRILCGSRIPVFQFAEELVPPKSNPVTWVSTSLHVTAGSKATRAEPV